MLAARQSQPQQYLNGQLSYWPCLYSQSQCKTVFDTCTDTIQWQQTKVKLFGRWVSEPRLTAWYSDPDVHYGYSGRILTPVQWSPLLKTVKEQVQLMTGYQFNAVLCNLYRDGEDYMGWHSDDEASLGSNPVIASLSLGEEREFILRSKSDYQKKYRITLQNGSLLLMQGELQADWQHSLPKRKRIKEARVNLTFRHIKTQ